VYFGLCGNQVSVGMMEKILTDANKNTCTLAAKSETQKRSVVLKKRSVELRNKMIILCMVGSCFEY